MVYVHSNLRLIYRKREEWVKGKTKMWDVFPDDMGLDGSIELALANMDLNDPVLEPILLMRRMRCLLMSHPPPH